MTSRRKKELYPVALSPCKRAASFSLQVSRRICLGEKFGMNDPGNVADLFGESGTVIALGHGALTYLWQCQR